MSNIKKLLNPRLLTAFKEYSSHQMMSNQIITLKEP